MDIQAQTSGGSGTGTCTCGVNKYAVGKECRFLPKTQWVLPKRRWVLPETRRLLAMLDSAYINIRSVYEYAGRCKKCRKCNIKSANDNYYFSGRRTLLIFLVVCVYGVVDGEMQAAALLALECPTGNEVANINHITQFADVL